jgi:hypothetical protein
LNIQKNDDAAPSENMAAPTETAINNHSALTSTSPPTDLTPAVREMLAAWKVPQAEILAVEAKLRKKGRKASRVDVPGMLAKRAPEMVAKAGKPYFSARAMGRELIELGDHGPVEGFNTFGDASGRGGHRLPSFVSKGRRYYDLSAVGLTDAEKEARQAEIKGTTTGFLVLLIAEDDNN